MAPTNTDAAGPRPLRRLSALSTERIRHLAPKLTSLREGRAGQSGSPR